MARKASAHYVSPPRTPVTSESLGTALRSGGSCQENKGILVKIHPQGKEQHLVKKKFRPKTKISLLTSQETERDSRL